MFWSENTNLWIVWLGLSLGPKTLWVENVYLKNGVTWCQRFGVFEQDFPFQPRGGGGIDIGSPGMLSGLSFHMEIAPLLVWVGHRHRHHHYHHHHHHQVWVFEWRLLLYQSEVIAINHPHPQHQHHPHHRILSHFWAVCLSLFQSEVVQLTSTQSLIPKSISVANTKKSSGSPKSNCGCWGFANCFVWQG